MMRLVPLILILLISCSTLKKYPLKSDRWENDIKVLESKDEDERCICLLYTSDAADE